MLVVAALVCPLVGVTADEPNTFHRVDVDGLPMADWETAKHATAGCAATVKLVSVTRDGHDEPVQWNWIRTRGTPYRRCRVCAMPKSKRGHA